MGEDEQVSVAIVNDYPVVVLGVAELLRDPRILVVELASARTPDLPVKVVLFDAFAAKDGLAGVKHLIHDPKYDRVLIYSWNVREPLVQEALMLGVDGYLSKALTADELTAAVMRASNGERVVELGGSDDSPVNGNWPGREEGLSAREAEVVALISQGVTNEDIAEACYLSINSVKSYIRSAYRKMGVTRRSQAVLWGIKNGMFPEEAQVRP
ncbi:response regulator transcription factor [Propionimicrobium sp. PCR01-08-3]|uniref:response regulator transcription factor n=1 Tax=Propionimicrobium sp. PCR01-08-3 TaxID=3052086 RepID=UPI00255C9645|nr:response regulator transcription factor [Propionimicrobium sp. PCR01-08-3]WIY82440.1 response regulator transcription factor [Propionimicrobium sp. PCR01-08-3]